MQYRCRNAAGPITTAAVGLISVAPPSPCHSHTPRAPSLHRRVMSLPALPIHAPGLQWLRAHLPPHAEHCQAGACSPDALHRSAMMESLLRMRVLPPEHHAVAAAAAVCCPLQLRDGLVEMGEFDIISSEDGLPLVAFHLKVPRHHAARHCTALWCTLRYCWTCGTNARMLLVP